ncbi:MAG: hypothetical protein WCQ77_14040 [Planctomycetota bacterium]
MSDAVVLSHPANRFYNKRLGAPCVTAAVFCAEGGGFGLLSLSRRTLDVHG